MESIVPDDFFQHRWKFCLNTYRWYQDKTNWFTGIKAVFYNFLRIPQNTFPIIQSRVNDSIDSRRLLSTSLKVSFKYVSMIPRLQLFADCAKFNIVLESFLSNKVSSKYRWYQDKTNWFTGIKAVFYNFLRIPQNMFPIIPSRVNVESCCTRAQSIPDDFFQHRWKFCLNTYRWYQDKTNWFTGIKAVFYNFLRIPQNTFPIIQSRVNVESCRSRVQSIPDDFFQHR